MNNQSIDGLWGLAMFVIFFFFNYYYFYVRKGKQKAFEMAEKITNEDQKILQKKIIYYLITSVALVTLGLIIFIKT